MGGPLSSSEVADVFERYGPLVLRRCRVLMRDAAAAEDAFQETFVRMILYGAGFREANAKLRWLYRVADQCCFAILRKRRRQSERERQAEPPVAYLEEDRLAARDAVLSILDQLRSTDREIAVMAFVDGLAQQEIGDRVGLSRVTVNKRLGRIRSRARRVLEVL